MSFVMNCRITSVSGQRNIYTNKDLFSKIKRISMWLNFYFFPSIKKIKVLKRYALAIILLQSVLSAQAKNYYFSSSTGDDAFTSTQAQNAATPWKSLNKLNSFFKSIV